MFWDKIASLYDLFENIYNGKVYQETGKRVAAHLTKEDVVLECACGTGGISVYIAPACKKLVASDYSTGMLKQMKKKMGKYSNVTMKQADITNLEEKENTYDVVVAGNVIHLLPNPKQAMDELVRVCRDGGTLIIPTYINGSAKTNKLAVKLLDLFGANFKREFDAKSYAQFFEDMGYTNVQYEIVEGRMACDLAIIRIQK